MSNGSHRQPTRDEIVDLLRNGNNWGRWQNDALGTLNLITPEKRVRACSLVRTGRSVSLSRPFPTTPGPGNPRPAQHFLTVHSVEPDAFVAVDYYGISYHGPNCTHIDALSHMWDERGMFNGRDPAVAVQPEGMQWGGIEAWAEGIVTRGILFDVPKYRGTSCVDNESPVEGYELEGILEREKLTMEPGDAAVIFCGRDEWERHRGKPWGSELVDGNPDEPLRPGVGVSCLEFFRKYDISVLVWDMLDARPNPYDLPFSVHSSIFAFGLALIDNARLEPLAAACQAESRSEFMLTCAPVPVEGGTGAPLNPLALF